MLNKSRIIEALESKRHQFQGFAGDFRREIDAYREGWSAIAPTPFETLHKQLRQAASPGALPTPEWGNGPLIPFSPQFQNHIEARNWAYDRLLGQTTYAVDGSQILPTKDYSIPIAAVQVAWFENPHDPAGTYVKDARLEILSPPEVRGPDGQPFSEQRVNLRRYQAEVDQMIAFMMGWQGERTPLVFLDGTLVLSFAQGRPDADRKTYVQSLCRLLETSEKTQIPLIGYVDTSEARDLLGMVSTLKGLPSAEKFVDAQLLDGSLSWGDRSAAFVCVRSGGILADYGKWGDQIAFVYLQTGQGRPPARLDIPRWVIESGQLERVVDIVRAEVIIGNGYPYAIETVDAAAVLTTRDRELFYQTFEEFVQSGELPLHYARKALSKRMRR